MALIFTMIINKWNRYNKKNLIFEASFRNLLNYNTSKNEI